MVFLKLFYYSKSKNQKPKLSKKTLSRRKRKGEKDRSSASCLVTFGRRDSALKRSSVSGDFSVEEMENIVRGRLEERKTL